MANYEEIISLKIKENLDPINKKLNAMDNNLDSTRKSGIGFGKAIVGAFTGILAYTGVSTLLTKIKDTVVDSIKGVIEYAEGVNKLNVTFKSIPKDVVETQRRLKEEYNLSNQEIVKYLGNIGDLLTGFGIAEQTTLGLAENITKLSTDLSSFQNIPVEQAINAITKAMTGEREMLKSLGVVVSEEMVKTAELAERQKLLAQKFNGTEMELQRTARANATYNLVLEQSKNAVGDFNRSLDSSVPNQYRVMINRLSDAKDRIAEKVLPLLLNGLKAFNKYLDSASFESFINKVASLTDSVISFFQSVESNSGNKIDGIIGKVLDEGIKKDKEKLKLYRLQLKQELEKNKQLLKDANLNGAIKGDVDKGLSDILTRDNEKLLKAQKEREILLLKIDTASNKGKGFLGLGQSDKGKLEEELRLLDIQINTYSNNIDKTSELLEKRAKLQDNITKSENALNNKPTVNKPQSVQAPKVSSGPLIEQDKIDSVIDFYKNIPEVANESQIKELEIRRATIDQIVAMSKKPGAVLTEEQKTIVENADKIKAKIDEALKSLTPESNILNEISGFFDKYLATITSVFSSISQIIGNGYDKQIADAERSYEARNELLDREMENERELREFNAEQEAIEFENTYGITQEKYDAMSEAEQEAFRKTQTIDNQRKLLELGAEKDRKKREEEKKKLEAQEELELRKIKKEQFESEKKFNIATVVMNTAAAITKALASAPFPLNMIPVGFATAQGAVQLAAIQSQEFAYATGGMAYTPQVAMIAEKGPEAVLPADLTNFLVNAANNANGNSSSGIVFNNTNITANNPLEFLEEIRGMTGLRLVK